MVAYEVHDDTVVGPDGERLSSGAVAKLADQLHQIAGQLAYMEMRRRYPLGSLIRYQPFNRRYTVIGYGVPGSLTPEVRARPTGEDLVSDPVLLPVDRIEPVPSPLGGEATP